MMRRARERAEYALLLLRNGLCSHRGLNEQQPRVRLGDVSWFTDDVGGGWDQRPDAIFHVTLTDELVEQATSTAAATPPPENGTKLERAAKRALYWCRRRSSPCSSSSGLRGDPGRSIRGTQGRKPRPPACSAWGEVEQGRRHLTPSTHLLAVRQRPLGCCSRQRNPGGQPASPQVLAGYTEAIEEFVAYAREGDIKETKPAARRAGCRSAPRGDQSLLLRPTAVMRGLSD